MRFSTSTVFGAEYLVPWLAAEGPLAYSPTEPPAREYFFQYTWTLPGVFNSSTNLRKHSTRFLFNLWNNARKGRGAELQQYFQLGLLSDAEVKAPMAA